MNILDTKPFTKLPGIGVDGNIVAVKAKKFMNIMIGPRIRII